MATGTWTIKRCLDWTRDYLRDKGDERPRLAAEWLLSGVTGKSRTQLYMDFDEPMEPSELAAMHNAVVRRAKGEPLQYIVGHTAFRDIEVSCKPGVLIPRPETELLVEEVLSYLDREVLGTHEAPSKAELPWNAEVQAAREEEERAQAERAAAADNPDETDPAPGDTVDMEPHAFDADADTAYGGEGDAPEQTPRQDGPGPEMRTARVLEVGCGTGCISLSIAHERPGRVTCIATDIEPRAVELACENRDTLGIAPEQVDIRLGNLVSPLDRDTEWGTFDVLVSNPPYIPTSVMGTLPHEVRDFEPALALDGGDDGLGIFRRLVNAAPHMLRPCGLLACELFEGHLDQAEEICREKGLQHVCRVNDLAGKPRIILAMAACAGPSGSETE